MTEVICANSRRKALEAAVSNLLNEVGFDVAEPMALELLTELVQSVLTEIGTSARAYCELSGRVEPVIGDVVMAFVNMGIPFSSSSFEQYAKRPNRTVVPSPMASLQPKQPPTLSAGSKQNLPPHIPDSFPPFPDPHAYIRTPTHKQPVTEYEAIREKSAIQKRDVERALTRLVAKTGDQHGLFASAENNNSFPIIGTRCSEPAYLNALIPRDQVFDADDLPDLGPRKPAKDKESADKSEEPVKPPEAETIDNPYLRPIKMPKKIKWRLPD